jgi:hypothetical protein
MINMTFVNKFTRSIVIGITASCLLPISASAKDFSVGNVKTRLPTEFCGVLASNGKDVLLLHTFKDTAWINIDGRDILIKHISSKKYGSKRSVLVLQGGNMKVTIDSQFVRRIGGELLTDESLERVTFKQGNISKTIQGKGSCSS